MLFKLTDIDYELYVTQIHRKSDHADHRTFKYIVIVSLSIAFAMSRPKL
jgi:hypothetical protein